MNKKSFNRMPQRATSFMVDSLVDYVDIFSVTHALLTNVRQILTNGFVGLYLGGSLATGDFDPLHSDIDFLVVTEGDFPEDTVAALKELHTRLTTVSSKWARELEGSYIPRNAIRRYDPMNAIHPHIERGGALRLAKHDTDWVIQRHLLREYGLVMAGPDPKTLIDPVGPDDLRRTVLGLFGWWELQLEDTTRIEQDAYQSYSVLTMCRMLYTLEHGAVAAKPGAARWAQEKFGKRWSSLIERALQHEVDKNTLDETKEFIRFTLKYGQNLE